MERFANNTSHAGWLVTILVGVFLFLQDNLLQAQQTMAAHNCLRCHALQLDSAKFQTAQTFTFTQRSPQLGQPQHFPTRMQVSYTDESLIIMVWMIDPQPDSILRELSSRDNGANADQVGIYLDTYHDRQNGFYFSLSAAGTQVDARIVGESMDFKWNAVWNSKVRITQQGWEAEFIIPFTSIRYAKAESQTWGFNVWRNIRRYRDEAFWNFVNPQKGATLQQSGDLTLLNQLPSPFRLSVTPYMSNVLARTPVNQGYEFGNNLNGGLDLKYGINESFTLDATLVPDFGQVQSDAQVLNLTPFEVQFQDYRPFFTEGTELFTRGDLFYSRRIGGMPMGWYDVSTQLKTGEKIISNPSQTQIINASKFSGRTKKNLGLGFFNAIAAPAYAVVEDSLGSTRNITTQAWSNYNVTAADQVLKNNSFVSVVNTQVLRQGAERDANVSALVFDIRERQQLYGISGNAAFSNIFQSDGTKSGYTYALNGGKINGKWGYTANLLTISKTYDCNDLGLQYLNNYVEAGGRVNYNRFEPFWKVNNVFTDVWFNYNARHQPFTFSELNLGGSANTTFSKSFTSTGFYVQMRPVKGIDFYEPRNEGWFFVSPAFANVTYWISTDYRKTWALDASMEAYGATGQTGKQSKLEVSISPRYRATNQLFFTLQLSRMEHNGDVGYTTQVPDSILFGERLVTTYTTRLTANYTFTPVASLSLVARHYWSRADYQRYYHLQPNGYLNLINTSLNRDVNFNAFTVDANFRWQFKPGSELLITYKHSLTAAQAILLPTYYENITRSLRVPNTNLISVKLLYFLDYNTLRKALKG